MADRHFMNRADDADMGIIHHPKIQRLGLDLGILGLHGDAHLAWRDALHGAFCRMKPHNGRPCRIEQHPNHLGAVLVALFIDINIIQGMRWLMNLQFFFFWGIDDGQGGGLEEDHLEGRLIRDALMDCLGGDGDQPGLLQFQKA